MIGAYLVVILVGSLIWGLICNAIASNRGMEGGFWWGFFLWVIGVIIVAVRPNDNTTMTREDREREEQEQDLDDTPYIFFCKNCHASFGGTRKIKPECCPKCGGEIVETTITRDVWRSLSEEQKAKEKEEILAGEHLKKLVTIHSVDKEMPSANTSYVDEIRQLKTLLDDGIITQEEFESKKKQLLGL